jgi:sugar phosphate permease
VRMLQTSRDDPPPLNRSRASAGLIGTASGVVNPFCFVGSLLIPVLVGKILDVYGSFPAAFIACPACEALALVSGAFTRETGLHRRPVMVT